MVIMVGEVAMIDILVAMTTGDKTLCIKEEEDRMTPMVSVPPMRLAHMVIMLIIVKQVTKIRDSIPSNRAAHIMLGPCLKVVINSSSFESRGIILISAPGMTNSSVLETATLDGLSVACPCSAMSFIMHDVHTCYDL